MLLKYMGEKAARAYKKMSGKAKKILAEWGNNLSSEKD